MKEIKRDIYLNKLIERKENGAIKVITGIRRCGKSYLLFKLYKKYLLSQNVEKGRILEIPLDDDKFEELRDSKKLSQYIRERIGEDEVHFIMLDEVPFCEGFESVLNGLASLEFPKARRLGDTRRKMARKLVTIHPAQHTTSIFQGR